MSPLQKKPIQIYLRDDQMNALRIVAETRGESLASLVRQGVDKLLEDIPPEEDPLLDILGLYESSEGDLAENHDEYLTKSIQKEPEDEA